MKLQQQFEPFMQPGSLSHQMQHGSLSHQMQGGIPPQQHVKQPTVILKPPPDVTTITLTKADNGYIIAIGSRSRVVTEFNEIGEQIMAALALRELEK